jgi:hypothetical protein
MRALKSVGWLLLGAAFLAAAAESAAQAIAQEWGFMSASDVMQLLTPRLFDTLELAIAPIAWDFVVLPLLALPGWILLGVPGAALAWHYRSPIEIEEDGDEDFPHTTYEEIVAAAEEADKDDIGLPSKYRDLDEYDPSLAPGEDQGELFPDPDDRERADIVPPARFIAPGANDGGGTKR